jgi:hypothetical protein
MPQKPAPKPTRPKPAASPVAGRQASAVHIVRLMANLPVADDDDNEGRDDENRR